MGNDRNGKVIPIGQGRPRPARVVQSLDGTHHAVVSSLLTKNERKFEPPILNESMHKTILANEYRRVAQERYKSALSLAAVLFVVSTISDVGAILESDRATRSMYVLASSALSCAAGAVFVNGYRKYYDDPHYKQ